MPHPLTTDIENLARRVAEAAGFQVHGVDLFTHRIPMTVQVRIRRADGGDVSLDECAALSGPLGESIEEAGLLDAAWLLEVSSPGIGENLLTDRDFTSFRGFPVKVLRQRSEGSSSCSEGLLVGRSDAAVELNVRGRLLRIPRSEVLGVHLTSPPESA